MPYLSPYERSKFDEVVSLIHRLDISGGGELNYLFTELGKRFIQCHGESYGHYQDIVGALECCKLELYRRKISGYEDTKITKNGDVY